MNASRPTGHQLKVERVTARVKGKELAARMGVSSSRLSAIEREEFPSDAMVARYRMALTQFANVSHVSAA